jgi:hypothetical protein
MHLLSEAASQIALEKRGEGSLRLKRTVRGCCPFVLDKGLAQGAVSFSSQIL